MIKRIFDIFAWLGVALVLGSLAARFLQPDAAYSRWLAWGGLSCILVYVLGQWREIARAFAGRSTRLGTISAASVLVVLAILSAINYISSREHKRWDLTSSGQFTLSPQTVKVLTSLDAPLKLTVFAREPEFRTFRDRLDEYQYVSKKVSAEYVDPDKKPAIARQLQIQSYGTVAIQYKDKIERVTGSSEQDLTNGIIKVVTGRERTVYFTQGHGEKDTAGAERSGYNGIVSQLTRDNYKVEKLPLAQQPEVPADATVVVVAGPKTDLLPGELEALKAYLAKGGKVMLLLDPPDKADAAPLSNLVALAHDWAIDVGNDVVVDASGMGRLLGARRHGPGGGGLPVAPDREGHECADGVPARAVGDARDRRRERAVCAGVRRDERAELGREGHRPACWRAGKVALDEAKGDKKGPMPIAAAVSAAVAAAGAR